MQVYQIIDIRTFLLFTELRIYSQTEKEYTLYVYIIKVLWYVLTSNIKRVSEIESLNENVYLSLRFHNILGSSFLKTQHTRHTQKLAYLFKKTKLTYHKSKIPNWILIQLCNQNVRARARCEGGGGGTFTCCTVLLLYDAGAGHKNYQITNRWRGLSSSKRKIIYFYNLHWLWLKSPYKTTLPIKWNTQLKIINQQPSTTTESDK